MVVEADRGYSWGGSSGRGRAVEAPVPVCDPCGLCHSSEGSGVHLSGPGVSRWFSFLWRAVENVNHKVAALPTAAVWGHAACESQARLSRAVLHMSV